jgi:hypothetical protein
MSFFLEFDAANNTVRLTFGATVTTEDIGGGAYSALRAFVKSRPPCKGIADFSGVKELKVPSHTIRERARFPRAMHGGQMFVIVAPQDHVFGLSRMFSLLADQTRPGLHVVRSLDEAYQLLGIQTPAFTRVSPG